MAAEGRKSARPQSGDSEISLRSTERTNASAPTWLEFADEGVRATLGDAYVQPCFEEGFYAAENFRRAF